MKTTREAKAKEEGVGDSNESMMAVRQLVRPDDGSLTRFPRKGNGRFA